MLGWTNPQYPEKSPCRIRKKPGALASAGWKIVGWTAKDRVTVAFGLTSETMELPVGLVEIPAP